MDLISLVTSYGFWIQIQAHCECRGSSFPTEEPTCSSAAVTAMRPWKDIVNVFALGFRPDESGSWNESRRP